jgi:ribonuclease BN (tRNA processing enzyme)
MALQALQASVPNLLQPCDELAINVVRLESGGPYEHLSVPDAGHIIKEINPKTAILTHFGMTM